MRRMALLIPRCADVPAPTQEATEACKPVMGPYYREPVRSPGWFPTHLLEPLMRSFRCEVLHVRHDVAGDSHGCFYACCSRLCGLWAA